MTQQAAGYEDFDIPMRRRHDRLTDPASAGFGLRHGYRECARRRTAAIGGPPASHAPVLSPLTPLAVPMWVESRASGTEHAMRQMATSAGTTPT